MTINAGEFLIAFVAAMGIPSAIMGFIVWKLERKIAARDKRAEEQDEAQKDFFLLMVQSTGAAIALGEATAKAVQRIPDANCNGDMHDALNYAANIKHMLKVDALGEFVVVVVDGRRTYASCASEISLRPAPFAEARGQ